MIGIKPQVYNLFWAQYPLVFNELIFNGTAPLLVLWFGPHDQQLIVSGRVLWAMAYLEDDSASKTVTRKFIYLASKRMLAKPMQKLRQQLGF